MRNARGEISSIGGVARPRTLPRAPKNLDDPLRRDALRRATVILSAFDVDVRCPAWFWWLASAIRDGAADLTLPPTQEALDPEFKLIQLLEGRVDPLTVGVWQRKLKAREAVAYFQYSDANGGQWRAIGRPRQTQAPIGRVFFANASKSVAA